MEQKKYNIFDGEEHEAVTLRITTNKNIRSVCKVFAQSPHLVSEERQFYAELGELPREMIDEDTYSLDVEDNFSPYYPTVGIHWAGVAEKLFIDCPQILAFNETDEEYVIANNELFDNLIRSEVQRGWADFLDAFGMKPFEVMVYLGFLPNDLNTQLRAVEEMLTSTDTDSKPKNGEAESKADSAVGKVSL